MAGQVFYKRKSDGAIIPINPGPKGDKGDTGPQGPKGDPGQDGQDFTPTDADARYVNADGDTMTGPLIVDTGSMANHLDMRRNGKRALVRLGDDTGRIDIYSVDSAKYALLYYPATGVMQIGDGTGPLNLRGPVQVTGTSLIVPKPTGDWQVPRLARTPNAATGDLGLPGFAGSDTGWRSLINPSVAETIGARGWRTGVNGVNRSALRVRRVGSTVFWELWELCPPDGSTTFWGTSSPRDGGIIEVPAGFATGGVTGWSGPVGVGVWNALAYPSQNYMAPLFVYYGNAIPEGWSTQSVLTVGGRGDPSVQSSWQISARFSYITSDAWPTSLPGTQYTPPAAWT